MGLMRWSSIIIRLCHTQPKEFFQLIILGEVSEKFSVPHVLFKIRNIRIIFALLYLYKIFLNLTFYNLNSHLKCNCSLKITYYSFFILWLWFHIHFLRINYIFYILICIMLLTFLIFFLEVSNSLLLSASRVIPEIFSSIKHYVKWLWENMISYQHIVREN